MLENRYPFPISDQRNSYLWGVEERILDNKDELTNGLEVVTHELSLDVRDYIDYDFEGHGATSVLILAASDLVGSSYTESGLCLHIHATTCREVLLDKLHPLLKKVFKPTFIVTSKEPLISIQEFIHRTSKDCSQGGEQTIQVPMTFQIN